MARGRTLADYHRVDRLLRSGSSAYAAARVTGVPVATVRYWNRIGRPPRGLRKASYAGWRPPDPRAYCYLLGLYLGDGCVFEGVKGAPQLIVTLDATYPRIIEEAALAIRATLPFTHVTRAKRPGCVALRASSWAWPNAFPQHGPGRKHRRRIELTDWQRRLTHRTPAALIRGLIHSDGCRSVNRFSTELPSGRVAEYEYVRYFFTNYSEDIRRIFCEHCELLGIRWTQSSFKNISIAHRRSVAILEELVGSKR
jgi:hypothetical protein